MKLEMCNINDYDGIDPFIISDRLMNDEHELVLKGYGWNHHFATICIVHDLIHIII